MRKIVAIICGVFLFSLPGFNAYSQKDNEPKIVGSGNVITKDIAVQSFDQLEASGVFHLVLTQGNKEAVKIEAEDNLQSLFEVKNEGNKLVVDMKKDTHFDGKKKMTVYVTFKNLKSLDLKMVGNVTSAGNLNFGDLSLENKSVGSVDLALNAQKLDIKNKSVGNLKLSGKAESAVIRSNSVGAIKASELLVQSMDIDNDGIGFAEVNAIKELKVKDSFLGKVKNTGNAIVKKKVVI